jgi:endoglucanase Acf2
MANVPLNAFKTVTAAVTSTPTNIYTTPAGVTGIVLGTQVANITSSGSATITAWHVRGVVSNELVNTFEIPYSDAVSVVAGKLVLESGDTLRVQGSANGALRITLSILESAND